MTALNMKSYTLPIVFSLFGIVNAASHSIDVGEDGLVFSPNSATAAVGDTVTFHFYPRAHGVARSSYPSPCAAMDNGFNSGFVKVASGESNTTFTITVNNTDPIWYYCPQGDHCQAGMVVASELGYSLTGGCGRSSNDQTIGAFIVAASSAGTSTVPEQVYGGVLGAEGSAGGAAVGGSSASASGAGMSSSMMSSSMMSSSMMSSSMAFSMASSSMASSTARSSSSAASAATGSASRSQGSATSGAASATSSIAASTGAASSIKSAGFVQLGLGLLFGGWMFV
ncbi:hypothetical protein D6D02_08857 [Aureobasidium pullulans]|nr:hypothetical protein D6D23_07094 [Aureobasidium pullulans]THY00567.1 hypothetical protein D6D02_08857 [Aureobasidium pullulans]